LRHWPFAEIALVTLGGLSYLGSGQRSVARAAGPFISSRPRPMLRHRLILLKTARQNCGLVLNLRSEWTGTPLIGRKLG